MGKISPVSTKYIIHASIASDGVVEKPDVIGAVFGQTEGLLGNELELRELQKSGRIGRIDVNLSRKKGHAEGEIIIPSSLNKAETALIAAAIETIERVGPCDAKIKISHIEDVRVVKRKQVVARAKELLAEMMQSFDSDSKEMSETVFLSVRTAEIVEYGSEKLPAGPGIDETDELIVVEGRADVVTLLRGGFRNVISLNGTSIPKSVIELSKVKETTLFVDGDRGGELILSEFKQRGELDFLATAPAGKEVEELTQKEIHKALRAKVPLDQANGVAKKQETTAPRTTMNSNGRKKNRHDMREQHRNQNHEQKRSATLTESQRKTFKTLLEDLTGTSGAYILDDALQILGKVPISELKSSLKELDAGYALVLDGEIDKALVETASSRKIAFIVGVSAKISSMRGLRIITLNEL
ncbi:hypothetical protein COT72_00445 [archaeon CG10_big_fil_rev_8_21_14_0_10_43_11]|nr:MAG: hypothetical protein COT72_00445 [archaeon CG10_big_fil_rev_8_21_14_0_10_43_11]